jgi:isocitrate dehydrogenase
VNSLIYTYIFTTNAEDVYRTLVLSMSHEERSSVRDFNENGITGKWMANKDTCFAFSSSGS